VTSFVIEKFDVTVHGQQLIWKPTSVYDRDPTFRSVNINIYNQSFQNSGRYILLRKPRLPFLPWW